MLCGLNLCMSLAISTLLLPLIYTNDSGNVLGTITHAHRGATGNPDPAALGLVFAKPGCGLASETHGCTW